MFPEISSKDHHTHHNHDGGGGGGFRRDGGGDHGRDGCCARGGHGYGGKSRPSI